MSNGSPLMERAMEMTFVSDPVTARKLKTLVSALSLPADNLAARWAICRSLAEGRVRLVAEYDGGGKELKGRTLFGSSDLAPLLMAQLLHVEGSEAVSGSLREVVLAHWKRGQSLLDADLDRFGGSGEALVIAEIDRRTLTTRVADFASQVLGQPALVAELDRLHAQAWTSAEPRLEAPVLISGLPGSGRSYISELLARSVSDTVLLVHGTNSTKPQDIRDLVPAGANLRCVVLVEGLDRLGASTRSALSKMADGISVVATGDRVPTAPKGWEHLHIGPYERDAVAQIVRRKYGWHLEVRRMLALAGRLRPALALERADQLADLVDGPSAADKDAAMAFELWGLDRLGVGAVDRAILGAMSKAKPLPSARLAEATELEVHEVTQFVLPYLDQLGLVAEVRRSQWALTSIGAQTYEH